MVFDVFFLKNLRDFLMKNLFINVHVIITITLCGEYTKENNILY